MSTKLSKRRTDLIEKMNKYKIKADNIKIGYETDIQQLQYIIDSLKRNLFYVTCKYELSQKEIQKSIKTMELLTAISERL